MQRNNIDAYPTAVVRRYDVILRILDICILSRFTDTEVERKDSRGPGESEKLLDL